MELEAFLAPVSGGNVSGVELRNDARFHGIERLIEGANRASRLANIAGGGTGVLAIDWAAVLDQSAQLAATGRDLRLLVIIVRALVNTEGFAGLAEGFSLLTQTVQQYWDTVHPELRPGASLAEAAQRRTNALKQMQNPDTGVLGDLEFTVVFSPRGLPVVSGADLAVSAVTSAAYVSEAFSGIGAKEVAEATAAHEARKQRVAVALLDQADKQPERMVEARASVALSRTRLAELEAALTERVGENGIRFTFPELDRFLMRVSQTLGLNQGAAAVQGSDAMPGDAPALNGAAPVGHGPAVLPGQVNSRAEVEKMLDLIVAYYERTEPSSPIPHLAKRMRKMVPMNFIQLMEEMAPSGIKEFKSIAGVKE